MWYISTTSCFLSLVKVSKTFAEIFAIKNIYEQKKPGFISYLIKGFHIKFYKFVFTMDLLLRVDHKATVSFDREGELIFIGS